MLFLPFSHSYSLSFLFLFLSLTSVTFLNIIHLANAQYSYLQVTNANCVLEPTRFATNPSLSGIVSFSAPSGLPILPVLVTVSYSLSNFDVDGAWNMAINTHGDIFSDDAAAQNSLYNVAGVNVGNLGSSGIVTVVNGNASSIFTSTVIQLNAAHDIIGRGITFTDPNGIVKAQCVIAITNTSSVYNYGSNVQKSSLRAGCKIRQTSLNTGLNGLSGSPVNGWIRFNNNLLGLGTDITYFVTGLSNGIHYFQVHSSGDVSDTSNGANTGSTFAGVNGHLRPQGTIPYIGQFATTVSNVTMFSINGVASDFFTDPLIKLDTSRDSIIGFSVVIYSNSSSSSSPSTTIVAQCVIGDLQDTEDAPSPIYNNTFPTPYVNYQTTRAIAVMNPTAGHSGVGGVVEFIQQVGTADLEVRYFLYGFTPGNHTIHIHSWGDISSSTGSLEGPHYPGDCPLTNCRGLSSAEQNAGFLFNGNPIVADSNGFIRGVQYDPISSLVGVNSIVGRGVIVHGNVTSSSVRIAQGVVGKIEEELLITDDIATVNSSIVILSPIHWVSESGNSISSNVSGWLQFDQNYQINSITLSITYEIWGLSDGLHGIFIHSMGDILDVTTGSSIADIFAGSAPNRYPFPDETGYIPTAINSTNGYAAGYINDVFIKLNGNDGVIGRSVAIHQTAAFNSSVVAQGVLGIQSMIVSTFRGSPNYQQITTANCVLEPTLNNPIYSTYSTTFPPSTSLYGTFGTVTFSVQSGGPPGVPEILKISYQLSNFFEDGNWSFHVHTHGDILGDDGSTPGGHYLGTTFGIRNQTGNFYGNSTIQIVGGQAIASFTDSLAALNGLNTIIGRALIFHQPLTDVRMFQCVIGVDSLWSGGLKGYLQPAPPRVVSRAACHFTQTQLADGAINGYMRFEVNLNGTLDIEYYVTGLIDGIHYFHVHQYGNVNSVDGSAAGAHFAGVSGYLRPIGSTPEIGVFATSTSNVSIFSVNGVAQGFFTDPLAKLDNSGDSIIGLAIVIHGNSTYSLARVAQCVIGDELDSEDQPILPPNTAVTSFGSQQKSMIAYYATRAMAVMQPASTNNVGGTVEFLRQSGTGYTEVRYYLSGLVPGNHSMHVHTFGDISDGVGFLAGGHYIGNCDNVCRPVGIEETAGFLNNGIPIVANEAGVARGVFTDTVMTFVGVNSVIGRSVIIHSNSSGLLMRVSMGVIGRTEEYVSSVNNYTEFGFGNISNGIAVFSPLYNNNVNYNGATYSPVTGWIQFNGATKSYSYWISWTIYGLPDGNHSIFIDSMGNILDNNLGQSTSTDFIGSPPPNRSPYFANEVGAIPAVIQSIGGVAVGSVSDVYISMTGNYGILGRSVTITQNTSLNSNISTIRLAQGVIGVENGVKQGLLPVTASFTYTASPKPPTKSPKHKNGDGNGNGGKHKHNNGGSSNKSTTAIAVGVVFGLGLGGAAIVGAYFGWKRYNRNPNTNAPPQTKQEMAQM